jgi:hypothetical protein
MATTTQLGRVRELSSGQYTSVLTDEFGVALPSLTTLTLSLYDKASLTVLNTRNNQNVLNLNNVTFSAGTLTWMVQPADHTVVSASVTLERHRGVFEFTWPGGKRDWHAVEFLVEAEPEVT